ncbi:MAG: hypothetical protein HKN31_11880 [Pricia sp.]|nr:hypothetical protein [Pricia sp.]
MKTVQKRVRFKIGKLKAFGIFLVFSLATGLSQNHAEENITLSFSDGRADVNGIEDINSILNKVGVRVNAVDIPKEAKPILKASTTRALNKDEVDELLPLFYLDRRDLLRQIKKAGRRPATPRGGHLSTKEENMTPYPKIYDMKTLSPEIVLFLQEKFGKLHVNSSDDGFGIDEVMTIVSGGPWTWFFELPDNVVGKLTLGHVGLNDLAWRLSYPGLVPHGGYFDAEYGLVVAFAHGPEKFVMRYEYPNVNDSGLLGKNPWIDFSGKSPKLL